MAALLLGKSWGWGAHLQAAPVLLPPQSPSQASTGPLQLPPPWQGTGAWVPSARALCAAAALAGGGRHEWAGCPGCVDEEEGGRESRKRAVPWRTKPMSD